MKTFFSLLSTTFSRIFHGTTAIVMIVCLSIFILTSCGGKKETLNQLSVQKEVKAKLSENKKNGWQVQGSSRTMEGLLNDVISQLRENHNLQEISGSAMNFTVTSTGKMAARSEACNIYAESATSLVEGRIDNDADLKQALAQERDLIIGAYHRTLARLILGELKEAYTLIRTLPNGKKECEIHYLVDETKAVSTRERAMEEAQKKLKDARKYGDQIMDFVREKPVLE
ncbi:hypothetical protein [Parabacteroides sp.]